MKAQQVSVTDKRAVGWLEVAVGLVAVSIVGYVLPVLVLRPLEMSAVTGGVIAAFLSGSAGLAGFFAAKHVRRHAWEALAVRRTSAGWLWMGVLGGVVALIGKLLLVPLVVMLTGAATDVQSGFVAGSSDGAWALALMVIGLVVLTPIGEELLFRGVVTSAMLRYGWVIGVLGSSVIFAVAHGLNAVLPAAIVVGVIAAELRRRSGSVWPGVLTHMVNNAVTVGFYALVPALF